ncbi:MAG: putative ribonucleotide transport ATP-binding protein mkl [Elusimicrobia bacterium]|nr:putative ribonucleotide transport ATP-binding protein mkl [Elusimicrobiota bacterium]
MIKIEGVEKSFGRNHVLRGLDLEIKEGETLTIMGGSGTGKSVLIKHMVGLLKPDKGRIFIDNQEITNMTEEQLFPIQRRFGYLFQSGALFDSMTVGENIAFGIRNLRPDLLINLKDVIADKLALVGLRPEVGQLKPAELSGGMKKRVGLARAIAYEPDYILYDEPTTGLDPIMSDVINELILGLQKKLGVTSVVVTHDMTSAYKISNRMAMLYEGKIVSIGTPNEIRNTTNPLVKQFVTGSSQGPIQMKVRAVE